MSKLSFRARALDASKPLPVFRCEDLPDLHEYASINRAVPQMPTGMEKEEESEHHLQRAISAQQVYGEKRDNMVIPVPEAESNITYYDSIYPGDYKMPKQLIHIQPFSLDTEQPDYDLDLEDEVFVNKLKKKMDISYLQFEEMIDRLEKGSGQQLVSLPEAKLLLKEDDELIKEVFDYWSRKRKNSKANSLIPTVKQEKRDGSSTNDPYVAFRRRTEKMQTRKNRKNDEASYEKMLKLRRDLSRAVTILEMIKRREKSKRELWIFLHLLFEASSHYILNVMSDYGGEVMAEVLAERALVRPQIIPLVPLTNQYRHQDHMDLKDYKSKPEKMEIPRQKRKYEKKQKVLPLSSGSSHHSGPIVFNAKDLNQYDFPSSDDEPFSQLHSGSSEAEEENDPDGAYAFRRKAGCQYYAARQDQAGGWPWSGPWEGGLAEDRFRYSLTTLTVPRRCLGMARRRVGRGGRVLLDRAYTDYDNVFHGLDPEMLDLPPPASPPASATSLSPATDKFASTSETNTSVRSSSSSFKDPISSSSSLDLSQILLNIKSCRWRHFRPRTLPLHELDEAHPLFRRLSRVLKRPRSVSVGGRPFGSQRPVRVIPPPTATAAFTAEQYQQHQEELALMHKQQLEQAQLQQHANSTSLVNMLDQASAQFAASAVVTAEQLLALKTKDDLGLGGGVNGVIPPSGVYKGLHLSSTTSPSTATPAAPTTTLTSTLLHPSTTSSAARNNNGTAHPANTTTNAAAATQVLLGNNSLRLGVPAGKRIHAPRTLGTTMSTSALKLAHAATANCQKPKVATASASPLDMVPRETREQDKPALNSLSENTVAMEVT
uniref:Enhancer of polycomb homolog n=1 Tax=Oryzias melastigma TaxID=30732 RepID=A0A3B3CYX0_ORYME